MFLKETCHINKLLDYKPFSYSSQGFDDDLTFEYIVTFEKVVLALNKEWRSLDKYRYD